MSYQGKRVAPAALLLTLALGTATAAPAWGQSSPLVVEVRLGASAPLLDFDTGDRPGEGVDSGASVGLDLALSGQGRRSLYVGFSQHRFFCAKAGCRPGGRYVATGFDLGYRISLRTQGSAIPWIRLGAITTRVETDALGGTNVGVSKLGFGGEAGFGVYMGAWSVVALNPGIRVAAINTQLPGGSLLRMRYVVLDLGVALPF